MKKFLLFTITIVMLLTVSAVIADDLADVKQAGVLRFGTPLEYIPFVFEDENGKTTGMDIALMEEICRRMGLKLQPVSLAIDGIIDALNIGQVDVIGGGLSKTEKRALRIDFTRTYYNGEAQVIALYSMPRPESVSAESFRGMKLGVEKGTSFQDWVQENLVEKGYITANSVYTYSSVADEMKALDRGDVNMVMIDQDVYEYRYRDTGKYQVFYTGFNTENYAFGTRRESTLTAEINNQLSAMIKDGTAQSIANRFFSMDYSGKNKQQDISRPAATLAPVIPTAVPAPTNCVNAMSYIADVTIKDGQTFNPGSSFRKTWRVYNNGSCTWDTNYYLDFVSGDRMNGGSARVPTTVKPGQTVDISVDMTAPNRAGNYKGNWQMRSPQGTGFGQVIWVSIRVSGNAPKPTATPQDGQKRIIPVINYFYSSSNEGRMGDSTTVYWSVEKASGVTIYVDGNMIENTSKTQGSAPVSATIQSVGLHEIKLIAHSVTDDSTSTIWYNMKDASGRDGDGQRRVIPEIDYFYADSNSGYAGESTSIHWGTSNAGGVTIYVDGYSITNGSSSGSYQLQAPIAGEGSHEIKLVAHSVTDDAVSTIWYTTLGNSSSGGGGGDDGQRQITPEIDYFYADSSSGYTGESTSIHWGTSNAGGVTIYVDGYSITSGSSSGSYTLQAPIAGEGSHEIKLVAHSVTDDAVSTIWYTTLSNPSSGGGGNDDWEYSGGTDYSWTGGGSESYTDGGYDWTGGGNDSYTDGGYDWSGGGDYSSSGGDSGGSSWDDMGFTDDDWKVLEELFSDYF